MVTIPWLESYLLHQLIIASRTRSFIFLFSLSLLTLLFVCSAMGQGCATGRLCEILSCRCVVNRVERGLFEERQRSCACRNAKSPSQSDRRTATRCTFFLFVRSFRFVREPRRNGPEYREIDLRGGRRSIEAKNSQRFSTLSKLKGNTNWTILFFYFLLLEDNIPNPSTLNQLSGELFKPTYVPLTIRNDRCDLITYTRESAW